MISVRALRVIRAGQRSAGEAPRCVARALALAAAAAGRRLARRSGSPERAGAAPSLRLQKVGNFAQPTYVAGAPGASSSFLYVVEQDGKVVVLRRATASASRFSTSAAASPCGGERGPARRSPSTPATRTTTSSTPTTPTARATSRSTSSAPPRAPARAAVLPPQGDRDPPPRRSRTTTAASCSSGPTGTCTRAPATAAASGDPHENAQNNAMCCSASSCGSTPTSTAGQPLHGRRASNPFVGKPDGTRSTRSACATRSASRSTAAGSLIGDVGQDTLGGGRLRRPTRAARRQLRLGPLRGRPPLQLPRRQRGAAAQAPLPAADLRVQAPARTARGAARSSAATSSATPQLDSLRGRYLYADNCDGRAAQLRPPPPAAAGATGARRPRRPPELLRRGSRTGRIYVASLDGPVYRLVQCRADRTATRPPSRPAVESACGWRAPPRARPAAAPGDRATEPRPTARASRSTARPTAR